jgi:hypothetical protein
MHRWSNVLLFLYPLAALGFLFWIFGDATAFLNAPLEGTQP